MIDRIIYAETHLVVTGRKKRRIRKRVGEATLRLHEDDDGNATDFSGDTART